MSELSKTIESLFLRMEGIDTNQPGYHHRAGWNDALRRVLDVLRATQPATIDADGQRYRDLIASSPRQEISFLGREYFGKAALDAAIDAARLNNKGAQHG